MAASEDPPLSPSITDVSTDPFSDLRSAGRQVDDCVAAQTSPDAAVTSAADPLNLLDVSEDTDELNVPGAVMDYPDPAGAATKKLRASKRNVLLDQLAELQGEIARLQASNASLQKQVDLVPKPQPEPSPPAETEESESPEPLSPASFISPKFASIDNEVAKDQKEPPSPTSPLSAEKAENDVDFMEAVSKHTVRQISKDSKAQTTRVRTLVHSALGMSTVFQSVIYVIAAAGVIFVFIAKQQNLGGTDAGHGSSASAGSGSSGDHRRLGAGPPPVLERVAYCLTGAGVVTFFVNLAKQPIILGYLMGGILVGPEILDIVAGVVEIEDFSSLGLIFLLFMVGLELDIKQLIQMEKVVLLTGLLQFPLCSGIQAAIFYGLEAGGIDFGAGSKSVFYCALAFSMSSVSIVAKALSEHAEMDSTAGRLTMGVLLSQDIWGAILLCVQPHLVDSQAATIVTQFAKIIVFLVLSLAYTKFMMPVVFYFSSKNVELMLVISLCWCFFMCSFATLPFMGLSLELAALVSGIALATYPYSQEFNGKIKHVRDFFITLFFCGLGMQIPVPSIETILTAIVIAMVILSVRWLGVCAPILLLGGGTRLATVATINLSQVGEFALIMCSLGVTHNHIENDTLTLVILVFAVLGIMAANLLKYNYQVYALFVGLSDRLHGKQFVESYQHETEEHDHADRTIVFLGFHKVGAMVVHELLNANPEIIHKCHCIDPNEKTLAQLSEKGLTGFCGNFWSEDVMERGCFVKPHLVLITIGDSLLRGTNNFKIMTAAQKVWPDAKIIVTSDNPTDTERLYHYGASYVLRMSHLCADKLADLLIQWSLLPAFEHDEYDVFEGEEELEAVRDRIHSHHSLKF